MLRGASSDRRFAELRFRELRADWPGNKESCVNRSIASLSVVIENARK
jgi:hypothetical protein